MNNIFRTPTDTSLLYNPSILNFCLEDINKASQDSGIADEDQTPYGKECNAVKASPTELKQKKEIRKTCNNVIGGTETPKNMSFWNWNKYVAFVGYASVPSEKAGRSKCVNKKQPLEPLRTSKGPQRNIQDQKYPPGQTVYATYTCPDAQYGIQTRGSSCASTFGSTSGSESYTDDASSLSYSLSGSTYSSFISGQSKSSCTFTSSVSSTTSSFTPSTDTFKHKHVHPISSSPADQYKKQISDNFPVHRSSNNKVDDVQVDAKSVSSRVQAQYDRESPKPQKIRRIENTRKCGDASTDTKKNMACQTSKKNIEEEREKALAKHGKQLKEQNITKIDDKRKQEREEDCKEKEKQRKEREKAKKEEEKLKEKQKKMAEKEKRRKEKEKQKKAAEAEKEREKRKRKKEQERKKEEQEKEKEKKIKDQERRREKRRYTHDCGRSPASCDWENSASGRCGIPEKATLSRRRSQSRWRKDRQYRKRRKCSRERRGERGDRRGREEQQRYRDRRGSGHITGEPDCSPSCTGEADCRGRINPETEKNLGSLDSFIAVQLFPKKRRGPSNLPNKVRCNDSSNALRNSSYYSLSCSSSSATSFDNKIPNKSNIAEQKKINTSDSPELQHNKNRQSSKKLYGHSEIRPTLLKEENCPHCHQFKSKNKFVPLPKDCPACGKKKGILSLEKGRIQSRSSMYSSCSSDRSLRVIRCKHGRSKSQCELCSAIRLAVMHTYNPNQVHGKHVNHSHLYTVNCSTDWPTQKRRGKHEKDPNECELCLLHHCKRHCKHGNLKSECERCLLHRSSDKFQHKHKCKHGYRKRECELCFLHRSSDRLTRKHQGKHENHQSECELCLLHHSSDGLAHKYKCKHGKHKSRCKICSTNDRSKHEDRSQHRKHRDQNNIYSSSITYLVDRVASEYESRHGSNYGSRHESQQSQNNFRSFSTCSDDSVRTENMYRCKHRKDPNQCEIGCLAACSVDKIPPEHKYKHGKVQSRCKFCGSATRPVTQKYKCKHGTHENRCKLCVLDTYPADRCIHDNHPSTCALCCTACYSTDQAPHIPVSVEPTIQLCSKHKNLSSFASPSRKSDNDYSVKSFDRAVGKSVSLDPKIPAKIKQPKLYIYSDYEHQPEAQGDTNIQKQNNKPNYQRNLHNVPTYHQVCDLSVCIKRQKTEEYNEPTFKPIYSFPTPSSSIWAKPCTLPCPKPRSKLSLSDTNSKSSKSKVSNISVGANPSVGSASKAKPQKSAISMANKTRNSGDCGFEKLCKIKSSAEKPKTKCKKRKSHISVCTKPTKTKTRISNTVPQKSSNTSTYVEEDPETRTSKPQAKSNISSSSSLSDTSSKLSKSKVGSKGTSNISVSGNPSVCFTSTVRLKTCKAKPQNSVNSMSNKTRNSGESIFKRIFKKKSSTEKLKAKCKKQKSHVSVCIKPNKTKTTKTTVPKQSSNTLTYVKENPEARRSNSVLRNNSRNKPNKVRSNMKQTSKEKGSIGKARSSKSISKIPKSNKKTYNTTPIEKASVKPVCSIISSKLQKSKERKKHKNPKKPAQLKSYKNDKNKQSSDASVKSLPRLLYNKLIKKNKMKSKSSKSLQSRCSQTCTPKNNQKILSSLFPGPCEDSVTKNRTSSEHSISVPSAKQSSTSSKPSVSSKGSTTKSTSIPHKTDKRITCLNKACKRKSTSRQTAAATTREGKSPKLNSSQISTSRGVTARKPIKKNKTARVSSQKVSTKKVKISKSSRAVVCRSPKLSCKSIKQALCSPINVLARCGGINSSKGIEKDDRKERSHRKLNQSNLVLYVSFVENKLKSWTNISLSSRSSLTSNPTKLRIAGQKSSSKTSTIYEYSKEGKRKKDIKTKPVNKSKLSNKKPNSSNRSKTIKTVKKRSSDWSTVQTSDENPENKDLKDKGTLRTKTTGYFSKSSISFVCGPFSSTEKLVRKISLVNKTSSEPLVNEKYFATERCLEEDKKENIKNKNRRTVTDKDTESLLGTVRGRSDQSTCTWPKHEKSDSQTDKKSSKVNIISEKASEKELKSVGIIHTYCQTDLSFQRAVREKVDESSAMPDKRQGYDKGDTMGYNITYEKAATPKEEEYNQKNFNCDADSTENNKRIWLEQNNKENILKINQLFCNNTKTAADNVLKSNNTAWRSPINYSCELSRTWLDESLKRDDKMYIVTCSRKAKPITFKKIYNVDFVSKMRPNYELSYPPSKSIDRQISYKDSSSSDIHTDTSSEKLQSCECSLCQPLLNFYSNSTSESQDDCNNETRRVFSDGSIKQNSDVFVTSSDSNIKPSSQPKSFMVSSKDLLPELIRAGMKQIRWPEIGVRKSVSQSSSVNEIYVTVASNQSRPLYKKANAAVGTLKSRDSNIIKLKRELPCKKISVQNLLQNFQANVQIPYNSIIQKQKQPLIENANVDSLRLQPEKRLWPDVNMQQNTWNRNFPNKEIRHDGSGKDYGNAISMEMSREAKLQKEIPTDLNPANNFRSEGDEEEEEEDEDDDEEEEEEVVWPDEYVQRDSRSNSASDFYSKQDTATRNVSVNSKLFESTSNEPISRKSVKWKSEYERSKTIYTETSSDNNKSQQTQTFVLIPNTSSDKLQTETTNKMTLSSVYETSSQTDLCDLETQPSGVEAPASTMTENGENSDQQKRSNTIKRIYHYCSCGQMMKIDVIKHFD